MSRHDEQVQMRGLNHPGCRTSLSILLIARPGFSEKLHVIDCLLFIANLKTREIGGSVRRQGRPIEGCGANASI